MNGHACGHQAHAQQPGFIQIGQNLGFILTSEAHMNHHIYYDRDFAVLNGWSNKLGNTIGFFLHPQDEDWTWIWAFSAFTPLLLAVAIETLQAMGRARAVWANTKHRIGKLA